MLTTIPNRERKMRLNYTKDEHEKISDSQESEGDDNNNNSNNNNNKKGGEENKEKTTTTTAAAKTDKSNTFDLTNSGSTRNEIIDILNEPDVAVWSKGVMNKTNTPADKVQEPSHIKSISTHVRDSEGEIEPKQSPLEQTVDPANKEEVAKVINLGTSLTDEAKTSFIQKNKKEGSF
ncbi:MAG: hypothetical protein M3115_04365 [Thermoproteota archaeon]|nr:hypothetical protein [Thermoproteota archaeon]